MSYSDWLHYVTKKGSINSVKKILKKENLEGKDAEGNTVLHIAAQYNYSDCVDHFLKQGADKEARNNLGMTPLHVAINYGSYRCASFLLSNGSDKNARDDAGNTPLHFAANDCIRVSCLNLLLRCLNKDEINAQNNSGNTALHIAAKNGDTQYVEKLLGFGLDVTIRNAKGETALK
jgi:ankyrin repeat protein